MTSEMTRSSRILANLGIVCELLHITSKDLAKMVGVPDGTIRQWRHYKSPNASRGRGWKLLDVISKLCRKEGINLDELLDLAAARSFERDSLKKDSL